MKSPFGGGIKIPTGRRNLGLAKNSAHVSSLRPDLIDKRLRDPAYLQKLENIDFLEKNFKLDKYLPSAQVLLRDNLEKIKNKQELKKFAKDYQLKILNSFRDDASIRSPRRLSRKGSVSKLSRNSSATKLNMKRVSLPPQLSELNGRLQSVEATHRRFGSPSPI